MTGCIISAIALVLILIGIIFEENLIAFEDRVWEYIKDRAAYVVAQVIVKYRHLKAKVR